MKHIIMIKCQKHVQPQVMNSMTILRSQRSSYKIHVILFTSNTENSFTTPVFSGSTLLRSAAGELVEEIVKWTRRNKVIDDAFVEETFSQINSLYKLDQIETQSGKKEFEALPTESIILIVGLGVIWLGMGSCFVIDKIKKRKKQ